MRPTVLPDDVVGALLRLLKAAGLRYGAVDMRRTPDGRHVFLEVNPAGQWRFVEQVTGQPITAAMARLLTALDTT
jgi:glutathione synthase/RimK-type ligase-like ATP-grasp enzyme